MEIWELVAREQICNTINKYAHAVDKVRFPVLASTFAPDGILEVMHGKTAVGHDEIITLLSTFMQETDTFRGDRTASGFYTRHVSSNIWFEEVTTTHARVSSYFTTYTPIGADHWGRYYDTFVPVGDDWLLKHRLAVVDPNDL